MSGPAEFLADHALLLCGGVSALLAGGAAAALIQRHPVQRQRLSELTIGCVLVWLILACVPMPRWLKAETRPAVTVPPHELDVWRHAPPPGKPQGPRIANYVMRLPEFPAALPGVTAPEFVASSGPPAVTSTHPSFAPRHIDWGLGLARFYLAGVGAFLTWLLLGHVLLARMILRALPPESSLVALFNSVAAEMRSPRARLLISDRPIRPFSCGIFRPTVMIGPDTASRHDGRCLRQVFRHELAHLCQHDALGNALFNLAMPILYVHPLYWWLRSRSFLAREMIADDFAAACTGRVSYASDLLALARSCTARRPGPLGAVGMFHFTTDLSRRITMLVQSRESLKTGCSKPWRLGWLVASACALVVMCGALGLRPAAAQDAGERPREAAKPGDAASATDTDLARLNILNVAAQEAQNADNASNKDGTRQAGLDLQLARQQQLVAQRQQLEAERRQLEEQLKAAQDRLMALQKQLAGLQDAQAKAQEFLRDPQALKEDNEADRAAKQRTDMIARAAKARDLADVEHGKGFESASFLGVRGAGDAATSGALVRPELDLVSLATSYADAAGNVRVAQAKANTFHGSYDPREQAVSRAELQSAQAKFQLLRRIAEVAASQAEEELERAQQAQKNGVMSISQFQEIRARMRILQTILGSPQDSADKDAPADDVRGK